MAAEDNSHIETLMEDNDPHTKVPKDTGKSDPYSDISDESEVRGNDKGKEKSDFVGSRNDDKKQRKPSRSKSLSHRSASKRSHGKVDRSTSRSTSAYSDRR